MNNREDIPIHESDLTQDYACPHCPGVSFDTLFQFNRHRREVHQEFAAPLSREGHGR